MVIGNVSASNASDIYNKVSSMTTDNMNVEHAIENANETNENNQENVIEENQKYSKDDLDKAINKINKFLEDEKTHAEYSVHKDLGTMMIKIVEDETKDVILEVPPEKILDMVASMCKSFGLLDKTV